MLVYLIFFLLMPSQGKNLLTPCTYSLWTSYVARTLLVRRLYVYLYTSNT